MAVKQQPGTMRMPMDAQITEVTLSPTKLCHYITDEELEGLSEMNQDPTKDIFLVSVGAFVGAITPAYDGLCRFGNAAHPMTATDLVSLLVAVAMLAIAIVTGILWNRKSSAKGNAISVIRGRPKMEVVRS